MAKEKDPAFLFYSKDWIEGTAELMPDEKGVFVDLLAHQHQKKGLPTDINRLARLVGLSFEEFEKIWVIIGDKFEEFEGRLFNKKLLKVMDSRSEKGKKNTIIGTFSGILRKEKPSEKEYTFIKNSFNYEEFMRFDSERIYERIYEWYMERLKSIENANANIYITNTLDNEIHNTEILKDKKSKKQREEELIIEKATAFYSIQIELAKDSQDLKSYRAFVNYLFLTNPMRVPQIHILKLNSQLTYEQFTSLLDSSGKDLKKILEKVDVMINTPDYLKNKQTIYFTINKWLKNNF